MNLNEFLRAFFPDDNEQIFFRAFKPKDAPEMDLNRAQNYSADRKKLIQPNGELELRKFNHLRGVYFAPNAGGNSDAEIKRFNAVFVENDDLPIEEQQRALDKSPLQTSIRVETKRSVHGYWLLNENCPADEWRDVQNRLISYFDGDSSIKNPSRVMHLPFYNYLTYNEQATGNYDCKLVEVRQFNPEKRYSIEQLKQAFPAAKSEKKTTGDFDNSNVVSEGSRNNYLFSLAGTLRRRGLGENEILAALREVNKIRVKPPLDETELIAIAGSVTRYSPANDFTRPESEPKNGDEFESLSIPVLPNAALYGLAGEIVRTLEPHTEADNAALLVQFLAGFGCLIGRKPYFRAEADFHYSKIFAVIVGASSKGRKGTSWGQIKNLLCRADESFEPCIQDGLSSGEGLIYHVRDSQTKQISIKEKGIITGYQDEVVDEGAREKRALILEPEFARVLRVMQREGNTLSSIIRQAWDSDRLRIMTKTPTKATETHLSIVGHITKDELTRNLDETETANGFANRFLWIFTRRSKYLPEGGNLQDSVMNPLLQKINRAVTYARLTDEIKRDERARALWCEIYPKLSDGHTGLLGSVTSRAEAQVMRLACLYALLDCEVSIHLEHLQAALAFWQYCEDSARYIFGNQTGNKTADAIYAALMGAGAEGLTKTQIRDVFQRNTSASQVNSALRLLIELGKVEVDKEETDGRPREIFRPRRYD